MAEEKSPISKFHDLFSGSARSHAIFVPNGKKNDSGKALGDYSTRSGPAAAADYQRHLDGKVGLVIVPIREDGTCVFAALDVDPKNYAAEDINEYTLNLRTAVVKRGLPLVYFPTKSGGARLVLFPDAPVPATRVREVLAAWRDLLGLDPKTEIFPKQDTLAESSKGNSVNLPFYGDAAGFEKWYPTLEPVNLDAWFQQREKLDFTQASLGQQTSAAPAADTSAPKGLKLRKGSNFQEELGKVLRYDLQVQADGTKHYNYHGVNGQPCLIKGQLHADDAANNRMSRFVEKDGSVSHNCFSTTCQSSTDEAKVRVALRRLGIESRVLVVTDGSDWREHVKSKNQLSSDPPQYIIEYLVPEKALTLVPAPSYNCKTWLCLQIGNASYRGVGLWWFKGPKKPVPVTYHVPEMNESFTRLYMDKIGIEDSEDFLVRTMEMGLWRLDEARMLKSAEGRLVVLDTAGYFNPAEDTNSYNQSLEFAKLVYALINAGAVAVIGLYHIPKSSKDNDEWTLENSVIGSAGYGGILRSCLRLCNLNPDLNDENVHVYVQGLKNPGLKPFQLQSLPLQEKVKPGESPYLGQLRMEAGQGDPNKIKAMQWFAEDKSIREIEKLLLPFNKGKKSPSYGLIQSWRKEWVGKQPQQQEIEGTGTPY
jgi:hypothetical protein